MRLSTLYKLAAIEANKKKIDPGNQEELVSWIRCNCTYDAENEFFLVLGIGSELADLQAKEHGFDNEVHRAWEEVLCKPGNREKHEQWLKHNR